MHGGYCCFTEDNRKEWVIKMQELISVIVPVYNASPYLVECIESITNQTYSNLEILLINDGSTDISGGICDEYAKKDSRIIVFHQNNQGLSAARNKGIENAVGQYLIFVDSDDVLRAEAITILYDAVKKMNVKMGVGNYCRDISEFCNIQRYDITKISTEEALEKLIIEDPARWVTACWKIYHKSLFEGIRYPLGRIYEDTYVMHMLLENAM